tara:strand:+ start:7122 stop:7322 length:201 start_codon:yes stop_codon:yes gene_type:complete
MTYIKDQELRDQLLNVLKFKSRNQIVTAIKDGGDKFHQYHIDRFLAGDDVSLSTLKKLNKYIAKHK